MRAVSLASLVAWAEEVMLSPSARRLSVVVLRGEAVRAAKPRDGEGEELAGDPELVDAPERFKATLRSAPVGEGVLPALAARAGA